MLPGTLLCDQTSPECTNGANPDADKAHQFARGIYQFYIDKHNRQSIDNNNMPIVSTVHYDVNFQNAVWDGAQMVYGDGYSVADDVVGHELTHGVTQYESNLFYYYQSGAINESFSDIWGELYDQQNGAGNDATNVKWLIGEDLPEGVGRSMSNPPAYSNPDKMTSTYYYSGASDNGGVHTNSGVNNKAAYLLVDGGTFNSKSITSIGANKTLAIYYEVQTNLLTSGADYADLYNALYQGCLNLVGKSAGIVAGDCQQVRNAVDAVEMNQKPVFAGSYADAPLCGNSQMPYVTLYDDFEISTSNWTFVNGSTTRWQYGSPYGAYAHSGTKFLYADDYPAAITDAYAQLKPVTIPANGYLHFYHAYDFETYSGDPNFYDGGVLEYSINNGATWMDAASLMDGNGYSSVIFPSYNNPLRGRSAFVGTSRGYIGTRLNLSSLAGKSVTFRWRMGLDDYGSGWGWWLDDVQIYQCVQVRPYVVSSAVANINPTNAASVDFTVTVSDPVTGVTESTPFDDFKLTTTGVSGAFITNVTGSGVTRTVTVNTGSGNGTIRLDIIDNDNILDGVGNKLGGAGLGNGSFAGGEIYTIDRIPPTVLSIVRSNANPSSADNVNFTLTFSEPITGMDTVGTQFDDLSLITSGEISGATISSVSGSGASYAVKVNTGSDRGTIRLEIPVSATIADLAGNILSNLPYTGGDIYTINRPPSAATLVAPIGNIGKEYDPIFLWNKVPSATHYRLYVNGPKGLVLDQWYEASVICDTVTCSVTPGPAYTLGGGTYGWYIQTYNSLGYGAWSNNTQPTNFSTTVPTPPASATLISPKGDLGKNYTPTFEWEKVGDATYYRLLVKTAAGALVLDKWYQAVNVCNETTCSVKEPTLGGGGYGWYIQTYNSAGYGDLSNNAQPTNFTTSTSAPGAATLVYPAQGEDIGGNYQPTFRWQKVDGATYYRLYVKNAVGTVVWDKWYPISSAPLSCGDTECSVKEPSFGAGGYGWYIQTYSPVGYGSWSNNILPTNFTVKKPGAVTLVYPASGEDIGGDYQPTFRWQKVEGATYYHLYVKTAAGALVWDKWYPVSSAPLSCSDTECSVKEPTLGGGGYGWYIQAYSPAGYGDWSNNTNATNFTTSTSAPGAATLVYPAQGEDIGGNYQPTFRWQKVNGATYYRLYVRTTSGALVWDKWYLASSISCSDTECSVKEPTLGGGGYGWYIQTYSPAGYGAWSNDKNSTNFTTFGSKPGTPVLTDPVDEQNLGSNEYNPIYRWNVAEGATHYHVYIAAPSGVAILDQWFLASQYCDEVSCALQGPILTVGGKYGWYVQAYGPGGYGDWSNGELVTDFYVDEPTAPKAATNLAPTGTTTDTTPTFSWKKDPMATWYRLYVKGPTGVVYDKWNQATTVCVGDTCSVTTAVLPKGDYTWWVQAYGSKGYGPWKSATLKISP